MGDGSDNIKGINGVGIKTLQSKFPLLLESERVGLEDILSYCKARENEHKVYKTVLENEAVMKLNWDLMSLENLDISGNYKSIIADIASRPIPKLDAFNFKKMVMMDKAYTAITNPDTWLQQTFSTLAAYSER